MNFGRWAMLGTFVMSVASAAASGQSVSSQCASAQLTTRDVCQKAVDLFTYLAPQLGLAIGGGNAVGGEHNTLGPGRASFGVRINGVRARLPQLDQVNVATGGAVQSTIPVSDQVIPMPTVDLAGGVFGGVPIGGVVALGVDLLISLAYVPSFTGGDVHVATPDGSFQSSFGLRVSAVRETRTLPGVSVSYIRRQLPTLSVKATPGDDDIDLSRLVLRADALRLVVGKRMGPLSLAGGVGRDMYTASVRGDATVRQGAVSGTASVLVVQELTRQNFFGSASLRLGSANIFAELGKASGGTLSTYNAFGTTRADDALTYASLGLRVRT